MFNTQIFVFLYYNERSIGLYKGNRLNRNAYTEAKTKINQANCKPIGSVKSTFVAAMEADYTC